MTISHRYKKSGQKVTLAGWLRLIGFFLGVCALVAIVKTAIDTHQESEHAKWPSVVATIPQSTSACPLGAMNFRGRKTAKSS